MNLKIEIKITNTDNDQLIWSDYASGDSESQRPMFESAEQALGAMERHLPRILATEFKSAVEQEEPDRLPEDNEISRDPEEDERGRNDPPSDEELDAMFKGQSERGEYRLAH